MIYSGTPDHELNSFHESGHQADWTRTESNSGVRFNVDIPGKFDLVLLQFGLQPELNCNQKELSL